MLSNQNRFRISSLLSSFTLIVTQQVFWNAFLLSHGAQQVTTVIRQDSPVTFVISSLQRGWSTPNSQYLSVSVDVILFRWFFKISKCKCNACSFTFILVSVAVNPDPMEHWAQGSDAPWMGHTFLTHSLALTWSWDLCISLNLGFNCVTLLLQPSNTHSINWTCSNYMLFFSTVQKSYAFELWRTFCLVGHFAVQLQ